MSQAEAHGTQGRDKVDLTVSLGPLRLRHPVINASGTFDLLEIDARYERDFFAGFPFSAYVPKTITREARAGNPPPRVSETACGMINAIGLANPGLDRFLGDLQALAGLREPVIVSVGGSDREDYLVVVDALEKTLGSARPGSVPHVAGYELNVSCPNVRTGCLSIGSDQGETAALVTAVRPLTARLLVVKLTPNVTDVVAVARAAADAGADCVSLVNTFRAMVLDPATLQPFLGNRTGGLCGPAIKPIALRMVHDVAAAVPVPVIGMGGIATGLDALEFIACGAMAVAVGAANFAAVDAGERIVAELQAELHARSLPSLAAARGLALPASPGAPRSA
jgi:dihydroorotate dehydrogenase (NAD+) catalytic subunit